MKMATRNVHQFVTCVLFFICARISTFDAMVQNSCFLNNGQCRYQIRVLSQCDPSQNVLNNPRYHNRYLDLDTNEDLRPHASADQDKRINQLETKLNDILSNLQQDTVISNQTSRKARVGQSLPRNVFEDKNTKKSPKRGSKSHNSAGFKRDPNRKENNLLNKVHREFSKLREELSKTKRRLDETENKLTQTSERLVQSEIKSNDTLRKLTSTERKLQDEIDRNIKLTENLTELNDELNKTKSQLSKTKYDLSKMRIENWRAKAAFDDCTKRLEACIREKEALKKALEQALIKYHELNIRHENVTNELNVTQERLYRCYRGKTTTFCGFEDPEMCGFTQNNESAAAHWIQWRKTTPSVNTGPTRDHTCNNGRGKYIYVEATKQAKGDRARLTSPYYHGYGEQCLEFYYHMYGQHTGILNVYTVVPGQDVVPMWRAFGNQGNVWTKARIDVSVNEASKGYQVVFEVSVGNGNEGDIALDDFRVFDGACFKPTPKVPAVTVTPTVRNATVGTTARHRKQQNKQKIRN